MWLLAVYIAGAFIAAFICGRHGIDDQGGAIFVVMMWPIVVSILAAYKPFQWVWEMGWRS